jgi:nitroreductase
MSAAKLPDVDVTTQTSVPVDDSFLRPGHLVDHPDPRMPLVDAVVTRRTVRSYAERPVERDTFLWLVSQAMNAPTACNEQQWKIILVEDPAVLADLSLRGSASFLGKARQCFIACYNRRTDNLEWQDHVQSGAAFITTFQLLAHSIGVGSCWIGHLPNKREIRRMFGIHPAYDPVALVTFGYYRDKVKVLPRKRDVEDVVMVDRFHAEGLHLKPPRRTLFRTAARWAYYQMPAVLRRRLKPYTGRFEKKFYYEVYD